MSRTKEQIYREQMQALGIYQEILEPEIKALARVEREYTRAQKAWSATASPPGSAPSFLDPHFAIIQQLRREILQHREALGITAKALAKITGAGGEAPDQDELITRKLDQIAARVAGYDALPLSGVPAADEIQVAQDLYETLPEAQEAARISDQLDEELRRAVHEDMG